MSDNAKGCMVALFLPSEIANKIAIPDGEKPFDMHVTLAFFPEVPTPEIISQIETILQDIASTASLTATLSGIGIFTAGEEPVTYASVDSPGLAEFRNQLITNLDSIGADYSKTHGFTPHVTLIYDERRDLVISNESFDFTAVSFAIDSDHKHFTLTGSPALNASANPRNSIMTIDELRAAIRAAASTPVNSNERVFVMSQAQEAGMLHLVPDSWRAQALNAYLETHTATTASATPPIPSPATVAKAISRDTPSTIRAAIASYANAPRNTKPELRQEIMDRASAIGALPMVPTEWRTSSPTTNLEQTLSLRADAFNQIHPQTPIPLAKLRTVYLRGVSEYRQKSITASIPLSSTQWGLARVSSFLRFAAGDPSARSTDSDLLRNGAINADA